MLLLQDVPEFHKKTITALIPYVNGYLSGRWSIGSFRILQWEVFMRQEAAFLSSIPGMSDEEVFKSWFLELSPSRVARLGQNVHGWTIEETERFNTMLEHLALHRHEEPFQNTYVNSIMRIVRCSPWGNLSWYAHRSMTDEHILASTLLLMRNDFYLVSKEYDRNYTNSTMTDALTKLQLFVGNFESALEYLRNQEGISETTADYLQSLYRAPYDVDGQEKTMETLLEEMKERYEARQV